MDIAELFTMPITKETTQIIIDLLLTMDCVLVQKSNLAVAIEASPMGAG